MVDIEWDGASIEHEAAFARLEDVLIGLPADRVLPDLDDLLLRAKMEPAQVLDDHRVAAILLAAVRVRPWGDDGQRADVAASLSLLELELDVLVARLTRPNLSDDLLVRTTQRLAGVRRELNALQAVL